jgi:hypothetical protein
VIPRQDRTGQVRSYDIIPYHVIPYHAMSGHTMPCQVESSCTESHCIGLYSNKVYYIASDQIALHACIDAQREGGVREGLGEGYGMVWLGRVQDKR